MIEEKIVEILNSFTPKLEKFNIIDIGCREGGVERYVRAKLNTPSYWIGIDPCNYGATAYDKYFELALDNVIEEKEGMLNEFPLETGCNSLLELNVDAITHDKSEYDSKWWIKTEIEKSQSKKLVKINSAYNILKKLEFNDFIHYVKIDTQGNDINVIKSFGSYLEKIFYIQIESVSSHNKDITLYKNQNILEEDVEELKKLGFSLFFMEDYSIGKDACPEADVIFVNTKLK